MFLGSSSPTGPCAAIMELPVLFASRWNQWMYEFVASPTTEKFAAATAFANLDNICPCHPLPLVLLNSVLRQKLIKLHYADGFAHRFMSSEEEPHPVMKESALHAIGTADIADLVSGRIVSPVALSELFTKWFSFNLDAVECRPFEYNGSWNTVSLNAVSGCSNEQFRGLGRAIGLAVYFHVAIRRTLNSALPSILLGQRSGWKLNDLRSDNVWHFNHILGEFSGKEIKKEEFLARIDYYIHGSKRSVFEAVCDGFNEIVPNSVTMGLIDPEHLELILSGQWPLVGLDLRLSLETKEMPDKLRMFLSYIDMSPATALSVFQLTTGLEFPPAGGIPVMAPPMSAQLVPCDNDSKVHAHQDRRILFIPDCDNIQTLRDLLAKAITPSWDLL